LLLVNQANVNSTFAFAFFTVTAFLVVAHGSGGGVAQATATRFEDRGQGDQQGCTDGIFFNQDPNLGKFWRVLL
jgi:hypothetical protein